MAQCKVGVLEAYQALPGDDRVTLVDWTADELRDQHGRRVSATVMSKALAAVGHQVGTTALKDHRAGRCCCWRAD